MELKKLYPKWIQSVMAGSIVEVKSSIQLLHTLKLSLLHQAYLTDLFGVCLWSNQVEVNWRCWSYTYEKTYHLRSSSTDQQSSCYLWSSANWFERETWEMFGTSFTGHPDLRRLLTDYGFRGWPLRKSYPVIGYYQLTYSEKTKRIQSQPVHLGQEFRKFQYQSVWQS